MKTKLINLARRYDRLHTVTEQIKRFGITEFERFEAIDDMHNGFNLSIKGALKDESEILILEDDCEFLGTIDDLNKAIKQLPDNWDLLYLGANVLSPQKRHSENIFNLNNAWTSHAILYSAHGAKYCYENFNPDAKIVYDEWLRTHAQRNLNCFIVYPMLAVQADGYSDLVLTKTRYELKQTEKYLI